MLEAVSVGAASREMLNRTEAAFTALLRDRFAELAVPVEVPVPIAVGMTAGIARVARRCFDASEPERFRDDAMALADWAEALSDGAALDRFLRDSAVIELRAASEQSGKIPEVAGSDDRSLLINAATRVAAERGYESLDVAEIVAKAGLSRRRFDEHFDSIDACFSAAVELGVVAAASRGMSAYKAGRPGPEGVARAIGAVVAYLAANPSIARLLFVDILLPSRRTTRHGAGLLSVFATLLRQYLHENGPSSERGTEATVGAVWRLIRREVEQGRSSELTKLTPVLIWFALAPSCADPAAALREAASPRS